MRTKQEKRERAQKLLDERAKRTDFDQLDLILSRPGKSQKELNRLMAKMGQQ